MVWAASLPGARIATHHFPRRAGRRRARARAACRTRDELGDALIVLADPHTFPADLLLARAQRRAPGAAGAGRAGQRRGGGLGLAVLATARSSDAGAVACSLSGAAVLPCVSQGASPVGPEMTITAADGNVIEELASAPAIERLREAIGALDPHRAGARRRRADAGPRDRREPAGLRARRLPRPPGDRRRPRRRARSRSASASASARRFGCTSATAPRPTRTCARRCAPRVAALGPAGAAAPCSSPATGAAPTCSTCPTTTRRRSTTRSDAPVGGFFCAGEIGPVGGRNFLHGFTATMAVFRGRLMGRTWAELRDAGRPGAGRGPRTPATSPRRPSSRPMPRARARIVQKAARRAVRPRGRGGGVRPGRRASASTASLGEGEWRDEVPADVALVERPGAGAARGRAHRAQPPRPPVRRRDADRALRRGGPRHRRRRSSTPARRRPGCGRSRRRRSPPAAGRTTAWAFTTRS